jgi:hypothetical protein
MSEPSRRFRNLVTGEVTDDPAIISIWREEEAMIEPVSEDPVVASSDVDDAAATITIVEVDSITGKPLQKSRRARALRFEDLAAPKLVRQ